MAALTLIIGNKNYSSWSLRPWLAMKQTGLEFAEIRLPLYQPESSETIRQYSPAGKVPILHHGTIVIWDSLAILEYLIEEFPTLPWLPQDKTARAIARSISAEMHSGFLPLRHNMPMNCRAHLPGKGMTEAVQQDIARITAIWQDCRQRFGGEGAFLFGNFTIADAMYAPVVLRFRTYAVPLAPICQTYADAIFSLAPMQEWLQAAESETDTIPAFEH
jgi:glutathione S-transferase